MPGVRDKIIINSNGTRGMNEAIESEFDSARMLGREIQEGGWLPDTLNFRDEMQKACDEYDAAQMKYHAFLRDFNRKLAAFIDGKMSQTP